MPMVANIPEPGRADWRLMDCPVCGRECWQSDAHRQALAAEPGLQAACTMCALRAGMRRGKEDANDE
ncbi:MAG: hypothetical protein EOM66_03080 [Clostridia bacterium]|nr:hypothetical protein [Clostridia bacterium]